MKYWIIADTHFNHTEKMIEYGRPEDYEKQLLASLSKLTEKAVLIHLGDICIGNDAEVHKKYIEPLKCRKILVRGNHDHKSLSWYMEHGWDTAGDLYRMKYANRIIDFSHEPIPGIKPFFNIHGHLHNLKHRPLPIGYSSNNILLSLERSGYRPHRLDKILSCLPT